MLVQSMKESSVVWVHFADVNHSSSGSSFSQNPGEELQASKEGHTCLNWSHGLSHLPQYFLYQFCPPMYSHLVVYEAIELKRGGQKTTCYFWVMNSYKMNDTSKTFILCTLSVLRKKKFSSYSHGMLSLEWLGKRPCSGSFTVGITVSLGTPVKRRSMKLTGNVWVGLSVVRYTRTELQVPTWYKSVNSVGSTKALKGSVFLSQAPSQDICGQVISPLLTCYMISGK